VSESALLESRAPTTSAPALADLILLRLLPEKKSVAPKTLRTDLAVCFRTAPTAEMIEQTVASLRAEGFVTPKGQRVTDAGRARALQFLGIEKLPPRTNWRAVKAKQLVPRALGLSADDAEYAKADNGEKFAALLLKRKLDLPAGTGHTLTAVIEALICRQLGHPDLTKLNDLIATALGKAAGGDPIKKGDAKKVLPRVLLDATSLDIEKLRAAVLGGRIDLCKPEPVTEEPLDEAFDLTDFANTVKSAARRCPTGRFGGYKVFINHIWNELRDEPRFAPLGLEGFKQKLVEANRANLLTLSRADLVQLMDPADVRESETTYLNATFHFILVEGD
jgi:hypothetical protein